MTCSRIALHEAAHAVSAELLAPGCMLYIDMCPTMDTRRELAAAMGVDGVDAYVMWEQHTFYPPEYAVVMYAPMWAEIFRGYDHKEHCAGDLNQIRQFCTPGQRSAGSKKAKALVKKHWDTILAVGNLADCRRVTWGPEIREVMNA